MNIRHKDILIDELEPFKHCKLGREKYATNLTSIVSTYADGFVLAINNEWGTGKTTFVKMWQQQLENHHFNTLYFNVWEHDFDSNPLAAILGELKTLVGDKEDTYKKLLKKGAIFSKKSLPALAKLILGSRIDTKEIVDLIKDSTEGVVEVLKDQIDEYAAKKKGLVEFRDELEVFIKENNDGKPLVFIIDELDRCRPNYAVEVLEQIKHFFSVPGIVFVLSIDKKQLAHAVRGVYGSEHINADEYLRRFIDLEYRIPEPSIKDFCEYLFDYFDFANFCHSEIRFKIRNEFGNEKDRILEISTTLFENKSITLRQIEKIYAHARVSLNCVSKDNYLFPEIFILLIYLKLIHPKFYDAINNKQYSNQQLLDELFLVINPKQLNNSTSYNWTFLEAFLIILYANYLEKYSSLKLIELNPVTNIKKAKLISKFDVIENQTVFTGIIINITESPNNRFVRDYSLGYLIEKINLNEIINL